MLSVGDHLSIQQSGHQLGVIGREGTHIVLADIGCSFTVDRAQPFQDLQARAQPLRCRTLVSEKNNLIGKKTLMNLTKDGFGIF